MPPRTLDIVVAGKRHRVTTSASEEEMSRLAVVVDERVAALTPPGKAPGADAVLLAALALAHDLEAERVARRDFEDEARERLSRVLSQVDLALSACDGDLEEQSVAQPVRYEA